MDVKHWGCGALWDGEHWVTWRIRIRGALGTWIIRGVSIWDVERWKHGALLDMERCARGALETCTIGDVKH